MKKQSIPIFLAAITLMVLAVPLASARPASEHSDSAHAVYIMTNDPTGNQVVAYSRAGNGILTWTGTFSTDGLGASKLTGSNQGGLVLSEDGRTLLVVNAGSNDISVFRVTHDGLSLTDKASSNGAMPISVTVHDNIVYALDTGGDSSIGNIAGYYLTDQGALSPIAGSVQPLSGMTAPAQISFNPEGDVLVVAEKSTSLIDTYTVDSQGIASGPTTYPSSGMTPFGFAFDKRGQLIVSEAGGGPSGTSAVSSYSVSDTGSLTTLSGSVPDTQLAACWLVVTGNGKYAYTANAHSGTISSYTIHKDGTITLLLAVAANTGAGDLDMALAKNSQFLYVFVNGSHSIESFKVHVNGSLTLLQTVTGIPAGADGLAAN